MDYRTYEPHPDLAALVKCYWTLEVPAGIDPQRQRIIPDGCLELAFVLGDDIKRYTSENEFILQPRAMVIGQTLEPFYIEPTGYVNTFAVRFYPYGFANFVSTPIHELSNKETPLAPLFGEEFSRRLEQEIIEAEGSEQRIEIVERMLLGKLNEESTVDKIVKSTIDALLASKGGTTIQAILQEDASQRRKLERKFRQQIGISPKQLSKVIRLQTALKMILNEDEKSLTHIAYESEFYDQAHFSKDFRQFTGVNPKEFLGHDQMALSALFYKGD